MQRLLGLLLLVLISNVLAAQNQMEWLPTHQIVLRNGEVLNGILIRYKKESFLKIELENEIMTIGAEYIDRIIKVEEPLSVTKNQNEREVISKKQVENKPPTLPLKYKGWYNQTTLGTLGGSVSNNQRVIGISFANVYGYQWRQWLGIGIGAGVDSYRPGNAENVIPVYLELRSYPFRQPRSNFMLSVAGGYGFVPRNPQLGVSDGDGGLMFRPTVGFRFGTRSGTEIIADVGYRWQRANFILQRNNGDIEIRDVTYQRFVARLGFMLWSIKG